MRVRQLVVAVVCLAGIAGLWFADALAGQDVRFGFLYMFPVAASGWWGTRRLALMCATAASVALVSTDLAFRAGPSPLVNVWNEFTRATTLYAIALLLGTARHSAERVRTESERAFRLAVTDQLTGLYNRHYLDEQLARIHPAAARHHRPYALLALDLDGFKQINDTAGHAAGDAALIAFTQQLKAVARADDIAVRTGGDEFVVLLPEATVADAIALSERLLGAMSGIAGRYLIRGVSAGAVEWTPYVTAADLIAEADRLVYESKRRGGGRVTSAPQSSAGA